MAEAQLIDVAERVLNGLRGRMETWDQLGTLAAEAGAAGAHIHVRETGFVVFKGGSLFNNPRSELVPFEGACPQVMRRAIDRVTA